jgi:hypothetical protein
MKCTHCAAEYTSETFAALALVQKNGGRMTYGSETHEYRVCVCGCHVLLVTHARPSAVPRPVSQPSFHPMYAEANARRR